MITCTPHFKCILYIHVRACVPNTSNNITRGYQIVSIHREHSLHSYTKMLGILIRINLEFSCSCRLPHHLFHTFGAYRRLITFSD